MKSMLMAVMAVAVAVTFTAPSFAEEKKTKPTKEGGHVVVYGDPGTPTPKPKDEKKGGHADTFGDKPAEAPKKPAK